MQFYGSIEQAVVSDDVDRYAEDVALRGYAVIPHVLPQPDLQQWRTRIDAVYAQQENDFGRDALQAIQELDVCRAPLLYDRSFIDLASNPIVSAIVSRFLGEYFILNLQNAIINRPQTVHHQSAWHRDLPYHKAISSRPLAINALWAIDDFSMETGGTRLVPHTHKVELLPSEAYIKENSISVEANAGSVIIFDAMIFHCAGSNTSRCIRRAVNHMYTVPIIKQQYDFPAALDSDAAQFESPISRLLGFTSRVPLNDKEWRRARASRKR